MNKNKWLWEQKFIVLGTKLFFIGKIYGWGNKP
jgi:hypothetical protein